MKYTFSAYCKGRNIEALRILQNIHLSEIGHNAFAALHYDLGEGCLELSVKVQDGHMFLSVSRTNEHEHNEVLEITPLKAEASLWEIFYALRRDILDWYSAKYPDNPAKLELQG